MKITICGSMKFSAAMIEIKEQLELRGHDVTVPKGTELYISGDQVIEEADRKIENDFIRYYHGKIAEADAVLVVNLTKNGIEHYVGGNTLMELGFAHVMSKKIYLLNPIPQMSYTDEIVAVQPVVINRDLSLL